MVPLDTPNFGFQSPQTLIFAHVYMYLRYPVPLEVLNMCKSGLEWLRPRSSILG